MPRELRDIHSSDWFFVDNRGVDGLDVFGDDIDRRRFLRLLADSSTEYGVEIHAYVLMSNHFHLVVRRTDDGDLADFVHHFALRYSRFFNRRTRRTGPLFDRRYYSSPLESDDARRNATRYLHRNPIDIVGSRALPAYAWSSLPVYADRRPTPSWLETSEIRQLYESTDALVRDVMTTRPSDRLPFDRLPPPTIAVGDLLDAAARASGVAADRVLAPESAAERDARRVVVVLAVRFRSAPAAHLADLFQVTERTIRRVASSGRVRLARDDDFAALRDRVLANLEAPTPLRIAS